MTLTHQMILDNADAITHGVRRITGPARLGTDMTADLVSDATLALLGKRGQLFDAERGNVATFCRMVAYQVARDALRSMKRGGQFSGSYSGFGNIEMDAKCNDGDKPVQIADIALSQSEKLANMRWLSRNSRSDADTVSALRNIGTDAPQFAVADVSADKFTSYRWLVEARNAIAAILPRLTVTERALWMEMSTGDFKASEYAEREGIAISTAHVRTNRLRAKMRKLLQRAA